jgi:hypothetical protein
MVALTTISDPFYYRQKITIYNNDNFIEEEWKEYQYAHDANSLFQCFFKVFPEIDNVNTEKISGLGFKNPFRLLNLKQIDKDTFLGNVKLCQESTIFKDEWDKIKSIPR